MKRAVLVIVLLRLSMIARMVENWQSSSCHWFLNCLYEDPVVTLLDLFVICYIIYQIWKRIFRTVDKKNNKETIVEKSHKKTK